MEQPISLLLENDVVADDVVGMLVVKVESLTKICGRMYVMSEAL